MLKKKWLVCAPIDISIPNACVLHLRGVVCALLEKGYDVILVLPQPLEHQEQFLSHQNLSIFFYKNLFSVHFLGVFPMIRLLQKTKILQKVERVYSRMHLLSFLLLGWVRLFYPQVLCLSEHNGLLGDELYQLLPRGWRRFSFLGRWTQIWDGRLAHYARVVTPLIKEALQKKGLSSTLVMPNGTDTELFKPYERQNVLKEYGLPQEHFYVGFIGAVTKWQALDDLFQAIAKIHDPLHLILAGEGPYLPLLKERIRASSVSHRVHFLGSIPIEKAAHVISCFDIAVAPMLRELYEKSGASKIKIRDYTACGRCVIAGNTEDHMALEKQSVLLTYAMDNVDDLAKKITELYKNPEKRTLLSHNARRYAENYFSWTTIFKPLWKVL